MLYKMAISYSLDLTFKLLKTGWRCGILAALLFTYGPAYAAESTGNASPAKVLLIPQWHLSPNTDTKANKKVQPQAKNQNAILKKLSGMIKNKELSSVVFEGCQGDSINQPELKFNGWSRQDVTKKNADKAQTHLAFRLLAKHPELNAVCGDDLKLIEKNQLALSDMRGLAGFKIRISTASGPSQKAYLKAAAKILKMPEDSEVEAVVTELNKEIKKNSDLFTAMIKERNQSFADNVVKLSGTVAVVIGSLHIADLKEKLEAKSLKVELWAPEGLPTEGDKP